jgi:hypothetical protein
MGSGRQEEGPPRNGQTSGVPSASCWRPILDPGVLCCSLLASFVARAILVDWASARYSVVVQTVVAKEKMVAAPVYM